MAMGSRKRSRYKIGLNCTGQPGNRVIIIGDERDLSLEQLQCGGCDGLGVDFEKAHQLSALS